MRRPVALWLAWLGMTSGVAIPVWAEGDLSRDIGAGVPGLDLRQLEAAVLGFRSPPEGAQAPLLLSIDRRDNLEPGCGPPSEQTVALETDPCPSNVYFWVESPQLEEPRVYELLGVRRALRFILPAEVDVFDITFVSLDGQTTVPLTVEP
jgi:hypothetical protein